MAILLAAAVLVSGATSGQAQEESRDRSLTRREAAAISRAEALRYNRNRVRTDRPFESPFGVGGKSRALPPSGSGSTVVPNR